MMALFRGPLPFYKLVYVSALISTVCSLLETSGLSLDLKMKAQDFEYILTWDAGNNTGTPTCFNVMYTAKSLNCLAWQAASETQSKTAETSQVQHISSSKSRSQQNEAPDYSVPESREQAICPTGAWSKTGKSRPNMKIVTECSNITRSFCNLTKEFTHFCKTYIILVELVTESEVHHSGLQFLPYQDTCLATPQFNISACPNCANVTVKLSPSLLKVYYELGYTVTVETSDLKEKCVDNITRQESFHTIIGDLSPNTNYCIAVDVKSSVNEQCTPSVPKCIIIGSKNKSGHIIFSILSGVFLSLIAGLAVCVLYKGGFICLRWEWPKVLNFTPHLTYSVFESDLEEALDAQVTQEIKKHIWGYDDDDGSESDHENDDLYTGRVFLGKISKSCSQEDIVEPLSVDCSSTTSTIAEPLGAQTENLPLLGCSCTTSEMTEPLDAEAENLQNDISKEESTRSQVFYLSEVNSINEPESEHSSCLNVNLNTVVLGISGKSWDVSAILNPYQGDATDLKESCASDAFKSKHFTDVLVMQSSDIHKLSSAWQSSNGSAESDSSDSETDCVSEYMRR
ncbi:interferon alpha/beta receptor 2 [Rhineura floridana]|uniref:interferon alpha/beta receptor 2 n=1 Tax=Rhineura floridana TaxID=261503 RepID=UPI002AC84D80|nr:interferon alpha/beta receptor 2 [Rhineura floridana]XP_061483759.1 interferon alpha/beta receptor 2 [Rhineura floridana]XP_061483760.1 interferon alpha/beta receptor 2 [Rhineura floridana]